MKEEYAQVTIAVGPPAADKPKEGVGWLVTLAGDVGDLTLVPGGTISLPLCCERTDPMPAIGRLVGRASDKTVTLAFVPATIGPLARGARALVDARITTPANLPQGSRVGLTLWAETV